jgi:hypothetical protein
MVHQAAAQLQGNWGQFLIDSGQSSELNARGLSIAAGSNESVITAGAIAQPVFQDLMRTPRMKETLKQTYPGVIKLREYAGYTGSRSRKNRMRS